MAVPGFAFFIFGQGKKRSMKSISLAFFFMYVTKVIQFILLLIYFLISIFIHFIYFVLPVCFPLFFFFLYS